MATKTKQQKREDAIKLLTEAQVLLKKGWTTLRNAVNSSGDETTPEDPKAVRFCASAALSRAAKNLKLKSLVVAEEALNAAIPAGEGCSFVTFNDGQKTKKPVLKLFQKAIDSLNAF
ncbi:MAG: DUF6197 family protein [Acidiferrobacterales bacterium]